jgi:hypothetical protein
VRVHTCAIARQRQCDIHNTPVATAASLKGRLCVRAAQSRRSRSIIRTNITRRVIYSHHHTPHRPRQCVCLYADVAQWQIATTFAAHHTLHTRQPPDHDTQRTKANKTAHMPAGAALGRGLVCCLGCMCTTRTAKPSNAQHLLLNGAALTGAAGVATQECTSRHVRHVRNKREHTPPQTHTHHVQATRVATETAVGTATTHRARERTSTCGMKLSPSLLLIQARAPTRVSEPRLHYNSARTPHARHPHHRAPKPMLGCSSKTAGGSISHARNTQRARTAMCRSCGGAA